MVRQLSPTVTLAEEVLQELVWLSKDREPSERERRQSSRPPEQQKRLEEVLQPVELLQLVLKLKSERAFSHARQILHFLRTSQITEPELRRVFETQGASITSDAQLRNVLKIAGDPHLQLRLAQLQTLCTYKDNSLPARGRLESALEILSSADDLATSKNQETLGLAGAIHKRLFDLGEQRFNLDQSLRFYRRGYEVGIEKDYGYTAINAAYVLDLIAKREETEALAAGLSVSEADNRLTHTSVSLRYEADKIRLQIVLKLTELPQEEKTQLEKQWWFVVTLAEAYFGLGLSNEKYLKDAATWLEKAAQLSGVEDWEYESTARQLVALLHLRYPEEVSPESPWQRAFDVLRPFLSGKETGLRATLRGKVGLSFSGGGFRAPLFHIGVLAKLAELDMLRNVEVISCVSAGSIIGAQYYLELRELLQSKQDASISRQDYIDVVMRVEQKVLRAVQSNIRTRLGAEILTNLKTVFLPNYTRTERIGELLERLLYSEVGNGKRNRDLNLEELDIIPKDEDARTFIPADANWRRAAKVPELVINATTLNTGHNWQFTTSWMGEPATSINAELDRSPRLRRVRYADAPAGYNGFLLRRAVAASTATLGVMEPVTLKGLYPGFTVRLIDGVFQGGQAVGPLLERDCNVLLISDASGQMHEQKNPGQGILEIGLRSTNILFGHLRARYQESLEARRRSGLLRGVMFLHLKKDLDAETHFAEAEDRLVMLDDARTSTKSEITSYGVLKEVQERLARIRTDIDAFSDAEAYALMMSGYLMTGHEFAGAIKGYPVSSEPRPAWRFLAIEEPMKTVGNKQLTGLLDAAQRQVFKVWAMSPGLRAVTALLLFVVGVLLLLALIDFLFSGVVSTTTLQTISNVLTSRTAVLLSLALLTYLGWLVITKRKTPSQILLGLGMSTIGFLFARLTLHVLDPWYLAKGRVANVHAPKREPPEKRDDVAVLDKILHTISSRPIGYLSRKADATGTVKSIGRIVDHARAVEAIGRLFELQQYETLLYPRDERVNPLQLGVDIYAENNETRIFTSIRTREESRDPVTWTAASELNAACSALEGEDESVQPQVEARLVLVDAPADDTLRKYVDRVQSRGLKIRVIAVSEHETEAIAKAEPGDPSVKRAIEKLQIQTGSAGLPPSEIPSAEGGAA